jgi:protocatechuate 3,4-dioxygenase beta subunit
MSNDDRQIGRLFGRRELVALFGASAVAAMAARLAGQAAVPGPPVLLPGCVVHPEQTEGPYFVDERLLRSDLRTDPTTGARKAGAPLDLRLTVAQVSAAGACEPLAGALVDLWQCDAIGTYSDARDRRFDTLGQAFLRGYQVTDAEGHVRFTTIYPGWYAGRAVHLHFKIRTAPSAGPAREFTSQFYFDDQLTDRVHASAPYAAHTGRRTGNDRDRIFQDGGAQLVLPVVETGQGYAAAFSVGMGPGAPAPRRRRRA